MAVEPKYRCWAIWAIISVTATQSPCDIRELLESRGSFRFMNAIFLAQVNNDDRDDDSRSERCQASGS